MSVTRLKRKHRKNIARANNKQHIIKNMLRTPVLKNVDLEELKANFPAAAAKAVASVKESVQDAASSVQEAATGAVEKVKEAAASVQEAGAGAVAKVKEVAQDAKATVTDATEAVTSGSVVDKAREAVSSAVDAVTHSDVVEKAKDVVSDAVDAITHSDLASKASEVAGDLLDRAKNLFGGSDDKKEEAAPATDETAANAESFDDAEAVTKPVNEDGQEGEHPKPEIAL
jgi:hypothetical protein